MDRKPEPLADELERTADAMERRSEELESEIDEARQDWDRKRRDPSVPGASPVPHRDPPDAPSGDETPPAKRDPDDDDL